MGDVRRLLAGERADLVVLLRSLSPDEWEAPSLCEGWRVRDVVAHLLYDSSSLPSYVLEAVKAGFSTHRMNSRAIERLSGANPTHLVDTLERSVGSGLIARLAPSLGLADVLVHQQDIRRPLERPRDVPPRRLLRVLDHPDPFAVPRRRIHGLRLVATDLTWSRGEGPEIRGTGEAIIMAMAGRTAALDDLNGDGVDVLRARLPTP